ncbi:hypothetical protein DXG03_008037 [Asterophora parasitica]|uniref:Acid phosphatase n=1 Tax=Asterophora parasitica TaxID=117018 RepID=A0A9P7KD93_9AGAR|nr:hypothetical protein DXG03_008037 [Asterophora parasitica]
MRLISSALSLLAALSTVQASSEKNVARDGALGGLANSIIKGKAFDRIIQIWLENTDFGAAQVDPSLKALAQKGLVLSNYFAVTHPSEPNYVSSVGGEYFGINNDNLFNVPKNVSTVVDLLEDKGISWGEYLEDMPSTGFTGFEFRNPKTGANAYVRKHNPLVVFESISTNPSRLAKTKNFTLLYEDVAANRLPQWVFITPNMTNDAHDTNIAFGGKWTKQFLEPLLENPNFNDEGTLVIVTFDENDASSQPNRVFTLLLGGAVPKSLLGKTDDNFYTHYSTIASIEANWDLHTLGRWDVGANVFNFVAEKTGDLVRSPSNIKDVILNKSYPGIFHSKTQVRQAVPNTKLVVNGRTVLPAIQDEWVSKVGCTVYSGQLVPPSALNAPQIPSGC